MPQFSRLILTAVLVITPVLLPAQEGAKGSIAGSADPGAQIVVSGVDSGAMIGIVAKCDGSYKVEGLTSGRYAIVEGGPHHATRKLSVEAGKESHVDLGAATPESTRKCEAKKP
jgi:hypothetical protein